LQSARYVARDIELHGQVVPAGSIMALVICAANRDESRYPDPDRFDIRRDQGAHLTFGFGSHYCLGQALARVEARIALEELVRRFPDWELDEDNLEFLQLGGDLRGWERLPVLVP
jgi:cytochrome P450